MHKKKSNSYKKQNGFSLLEAIIAIILLIALMSVAVSMTVGGVKSGKSNQVIADLRTLASQKNSEVSNDLTNQLKRFVSGQTLAGSINPSSPVNGYFDVLNEFGCVVQKSSIFVEPPIKTDPTSPTESPTKSIKTPTREGLGDLGQDLPEENIVDCSKSTFGSPTNSTVPRYRRQWVIAKDKPFNGDTTIAVIIIDLLTNQIVRQEPLVKVDGARN